MLRSLRPSTLVRSARLHARVQAGRLPAVQILRALAALSIVVGHVLSESRSFGPAGGYDSIADMHLWTAGVDLFFVLSGFIMMWTFGHRFGEPLPDDGRSPPRSDAGPPPGRDTEEQSEEHAAQEHDERDGEDAQGRRVGCRELGEPGDPQRREPEQPQDRRDSQRPLDDIDEEPPDRSPSAQRGADERHADTEDFNTFYCGFHWDIPGVVSRR